MARLTVIDYLTVAAMPVLPIGLETFDVLRFMPAGAATITINAVWLLIGFSMWAYVFLRRGQANEHES